MAVANQVGISQVIADVTPADKQRIVHQLQQQGRRVAMVGDGINDAPALAAANLGIALASGTGVAIESADIVLTRHDLRKVGEAILLARATLRTIRQNLAWAFLYNITLLPLAAGLIVPLAGPRILHALPALSAAAMALSSVSVVANSLWLRHKRL
jgi:Cu+-exporting ATPase